MDKQGIEDPILIAGIKLLERTGARGFQIRYSDDEEPVVWIAVAEYSIGPSNKPVAKNGRKVFETASGMNPIAAVMRLCDQVIDGSECNHCHKPAGVTEEWRGAMPLSELVCWYRYDPETQLFRRSCEGDT